jgi:hypothetical protein
VKGERGRVKEGGRERVCVRGNKLRDICTGDASVVTREEQRVTE